MKIGFNLLIFLLLGLSFPNLVTDNLEKIKEDKSQKDSMNFESSNHKNEKREKEKTHGIINFFADRVLSDVNELNFDSFQIEKLQESQKETAENRNENPSDYFDNFFSRITNLSPDSKDTNDKENINSRNFQGKSPQLYPSKILISNNSSDGSNERKTGLILEKEQKKHEAEFKFENLHTQHEDKQQLTKSQTKNSPRIFDQKISQFSPKSQTPHSRLLPLIQVNPSKFDYDFSPQKQFNIVSDQDYSFDNDKKRSSLSNFNLQQQQNQKETNDLIVQNEISKNENSDNYINNKQHRFSDNSHTGEGSLLKTNSFSSSKYEPSNEHFEENHNENLHNYNFENTKTQNGDSESSRETTRTNSQENFNQDPRVLFEKIRKLQSIKVDPIVESFQKITNQIIEMKSKRFNKTLENSNLFTLGSKLVGFVWKDGLFERFPFITDLKNPFQMRDEDFGKSFVLSPLKDRFKIRPRNETQTECTLSVRIKEANHYVGKFFRVILEFKSSCMPFNVSKFFLAKTGLRSTFVVSFLGKRHIFQFKGSEKITKGASLTERYRENRLLVKSYHYAHYNDNSYKESQVNNKMLIWENLRMTPAQLFATQKLLLEEMEKNYQSTIKTIDAKDLNKNWKVRNEEARIYRRLSNSSKMPSILEKVNLEIQRDKKQYFREHPKEFKLQKQKKRKLLTIFGFKICLPNLGKKEIKVYTKERLKCEKENRVQKGFDDAFAQGGCVRPQVAEAEDGDFHKIKDPFRTDKLEWKKNWYREGRYKWYGKKQICATLKTVRQNESYRVKMCRKVCKMATYYHSWNFCLNVCGVNYNYLSNVNAEAMQQGISNLSPWTSMDGELFFTLKPSVKASRNKVKKTQKRDQFSLKSIRKLWKNKHVRTCRQTWSRLICHLN
jgi:hypothetical protein